MQVANDALKMGRSLQRAQTGLIHYCYQSADEVTHDTIPVLENALFALALFRSRLADHVLEGKSIIERLLPFEREGNFPVYLHDFPNEHDPYLGLRLYPVLFWILHDFSHVIGELKEELTHCMERIERKAKTLDLPPWALYRMEAIEGRVGQTPQSLFEWGEALISLQLAEKRGADISEAIHLATSLWHPEIGLYTGPLTKHHQDGFYPEVTVFDLFMASWQKNLPTRMRMLSFVDLKKALIRPREVTFTDKPVPYIEKDPFFLAFGDHTFVLVQREETIDFYLNYHPSHQIFVDQERANTFQKGQEVQIHSGGQMLGLAFHSTSGTYFGRILRGNRPDQHACKGDALHTSFDWQFSIQILKRGNLTVELSLEKEEKIEIFSHP